MSDYRLTSEDTMQLLKIDDVIKHVEGGGMFSDVMEETEILDALKLLLRVLDIEVRTE